MRNRFILTPFFLDQPIAGLNPLVEADWVINNPSLPDRTRLERMAALYEPLAVLVQTTVAQEERPVSIAGDCCTSLGVLAGLQRAGIDPTLIWFDAHGDFNTWETTPSGFLGGMPLAMLVGRGEQSLAARLDLASLPEESVILSDGRDLDPAEREALAGSDILHLPNVVQLLKVDLPPGPLWVHFDTDVIDAESAPGMNYPVAGGPSPSQLKEAFGFIAGTGRLVAVSLSSWNPELDQDGRSRAASLELLRVLIA
jgi:arginase